MSELLPSPTSKDELWPLLAAQHVRIGQLDRPAAERTVTAKNYDSAIRALGEYLSTLDSGLPTKSVLEDWRDLMMRGGLTNNGKPYAVSTINSRLAAVRKILRAVADDVTDLQTKTMLRDWATVEDAKEIVKQDMLDEDYGRRLTLLSVQQLIRSIDTSTVKGLRDRAIIALAVGAGLRVSEVVKLTLRDVFETVNETGQRGIRIRTSKHGKSRIVVLSGWNSWVFRACEEYAAHIPGEGSDRRLVWGVKPLKGGKYRLDTPHLSSRQAQAILEGGYKAEYKGQMTEINMHDLRRTYAKLCKQSGMSWEALRANMGHSSVTVTETYVGHDVDWSERVPNWSIDL